ncbi:AP2/ERF domain-containing protein PFD0985w-like [Palaemon carinicauda]|uniref:AP2/ERF domain-containing protein PFD0985w-like n=1 Tax=Palaemon carinicauda TaxID=392227 RepID=UPI0035B59E6D
MTRKIWQLYIIWTVLPYTISQISLFANALFPVLSKEKLPPLYIFPLLKSIPEAIMNPDYNGVGNGRNEPLYTDRNIDRSTSGGLATVGEDNVAKRDSSILRGFRKDILQNVLMQALEEHRRRHDSLEEILISGNYDVNSHGNWFVLSDQEKMEFLDKSLTMNINETKEFNRKNFVKVNKSSFIDKDKANITRNMTKDNKELKKNFEKISDIEDLISNSGISIKKTSDSQPLLRRRRRDDRAIMYLPVGSTGSGPDDCPDAVDSAAVSISQLVFLSLCLGVFTAVANVANNINNNNNNNNNNNDNNINSNNLNFAANANAGNQITIEIPPGRRKRRDLILSRISGRIRDRILNQSYFVNQTKQPYDSLLRAKLRYNEYMRGKYKVIKQ